MRAASGRSAARTARLGDPNDDTQSRINAADRADGQEDLDRAGSDRLPQQCTYA
jgi:hypothetical protein